MILMVMQLFRTRTNLRKSADEVFMKFSAADSDCISQIPFRHTTCHLSTIIVFVNVQNQEFSDTILCKKCPPVALVESQWLHCCVGGGP